MFVAFLLKFLIETVSAEIQAAIAESSIDINIAPEDAGVSIQQTSADASTADVIEQIAAASSALALAFAIAAIFTSALAVVLLLEFLHLLHLRLLLLRKLR